MRWERCEAVQGGAVQGGTVQDGTVQGGTVQGGTVPGGTVQGGTVQGGAVQGGTVQGGAVRHAMSRHAAPPPSTQKSGSPRPGKAGFQISQLPWRSRSSTISPSTPPPRTIFHIFPSNISHSTPG